MRARVILSFAPGIRERDNRDVEREEDIPSPAAAAADVLINDLRFDIGRKFKF
jgi:hypothetical protein